MTSATVAELVAMIRTLADDLEAEIDYRFAGTQHTYPSERLAYDRDIAIVIAARQLIERAAEARRAAG